MNSRRSYSIPLALDCRSFPPWREFIRNTPPMSELCCDPFRSDRIFVNGTLCRRRTRSQGRNSSQQWYVNEDKWVAGTAADSQAMPAFFDIQVTHSR